MLHGSESFSRAVALKVPCPRCGGELAAERDCRRAYLRCTFCNAQYNPSQFLDQMDEDFDEAFARMPVDRL